MPRYQAFKQYEPSQAAAIIFAVLFGILLAAHTWQSARAKIYCLWVLILATALECAGYILREYTIHHRTEKTPSVIGQVFIIVAPACLAAALYMVVGRIMTQVGASHSIIRPSWITPIFVGFDILSIGMQALGAAILFNTDDNLDKLKKARSILTIGLMIQIVAFAIFLVLTGWFDRRATKASPRKMVTVRMLMIAFYITGALIMIRSIYRAIEFITVDFNSRPPRGYFFNVEWAYYVLDALPIAIATGVYNVVFPAKYLRRDEEHPDTKNVEVPLSSFEGDRLKGGNHA
ncbi:hypothetical protein FRC18_005183 [Serendipita sp. 400]|nr:hypothetical protein FRC18_005183 [Serendipita sp. 400]